jgi:hypothetical protein
MATTRFRLPASGTPLVSPAFQSYSHAMTTRHRLLLADSSTLANLAVAPDAADHLAAGDVGVRQFVSPPLKGGPVFSNGGAFKYSVQAFEDNAGNNLQVQIFIAIVSYDGTSAVQTIRSKVAEGNEVNTSLRNVNFSGTFSAGHTLVQGQRIVAEFSFTGTPSASGGVQGHNGSLRFGSSGGSGDLPENDTETGTGFNPWLELTTDVAIEFLSEAKQFLYPQAYRRSFFY